MKLSYLFVAAILAIFTSNPTQDDSKNKLVMTATGILRVQNGTELKFYKSNKNYVAASQLDFRIP